MITRPDLPPWVLEPIGSAQQAQEVFKHLSHWAKMQGIEPPVMPLEPQTCCARGCQGCVWLAFFEAAQHWRERTLLALGVCTNEDACS